MIVQQLFILEDEIQWHLHHSKDGGVLCLYLLKQELKVAVVVHAILK